MAGAARSPGAAGAAAGPVPPGRERSDGPVSMADDIQTLERVPASDDVGEELGLALPARRETCDSADIFDDLRMDRSQHRLEPLLAGPWQ